MGLKQPVVALLIALDHVMRNRIHRHLKEITLREGHRDYRPGQVLLLACQIEPWAVMADITEVRHCLAREVTLQEMRDDGFADLDDMVQGMKRFYPTFSPDSPVTVIRWANARGYWVDHANQYKYTERVGMTADYDYDGHK